MFLQAESTRRVTHVPACVLLQAVDMRHVTHVPLCVLLQAVDKTRVMSHTFPLVSFCRQKIRHASCHTRSPFCHVAGPGRRVRCFYCGLELDHLTSRDNVWYEHVRHSPTCPYLVVIMGQDQIEQTQTKLNKRS